MKRFWIVLICVLVSLASVMGIVGARRGLLDFADEVIEDDKDDVVPPELGTMILTGDMMYNENAIAKVKVYENGKIVEKTFEVGELSEVSDEGGYKPITIENVVIGSTVIMTSKLGDDENLYSHNSKGVEWISSTFNELDAWDCASGTHYLKVVDTISELYFGEA